jgi:hypothetical protein
MVDVGIGVKMKLGDMEEVGRMLEREGSYNEM